jgi:transcriptional regulator with XRE-family HTH domain
MRLAPRLCYGLGLILLGKQLRAARVLLGWSQIELANRSKVAIGTIRRMESFEGEIVSYTSTLSKVTRAMEKAGIAFLDDGEPGVRLRRK